MNIDALIDMDEEKFTKVVLQAAKSRREFPKWWAAVLSPEVIDETERVLDEAMVDAKRQALTPDRYPYAAGFVSKLESLLAEVTLARIVGV